MGPISLTLPPQAELLFNHLRHPRDVQDLGQDLIAIQMSTGVNIDVSWSPEYSPAGRFVVTVFGKSWDEKIEEFETASPSDLKTTLEHLATTYSETTSGNHFPVIEKPVEPGNPAKLNKLH